MKNKEALGLLKRFSKNQSTPEELRIMEYWVHHLNENGKQELNEDDLMIAGEEMWTNISKHTPQKIRQFHWMGAAAAILVFAAISILYVLLFNKANISQQDRLANHITAGTNKATLTLSDGKTVLLDESSKKANIEDGSITITRTTEGQLIYSVPENGGENRTGYNTLTTPKGGSYQLNLADGTKIWLNAASSIRFPVHFSKNKREVQLSGEAYFEVKHLNKYQGKTVPFSVKTLGNYGQLVEVLGTHFNINAYADEADIKTTLLEGSVRLRQINHIGIANEFQMLKPGQQSVRSSSGIIVREADLDEAVAWKNGYFRFNDESLESIMRKVEKWYNVDVVYKDENLKRKSFAGITKRYENVSELLKMLELTDEVKFRIDGNQIIITDNK